MDNLWNSEVGGGGGTLPRPPYNDTPFHIVHNPAFYPKNISNCKMEEKMFYYWMFYRIILVLWLYGF